MWHLPYDEKEFYIMFCKNCGNQMDDIAAVCVKCGVPKGVGNNFCFNCGNPLVPGAFVCTTCGAPTNAAPAAGNPELKSKMCAGLLGIFLGVFGVHNFYLGNTGKAVAQLLITLLSCGFLSPVSGIWGLIEGIMLLTGSINVDGNGMPLRD